MSACLFPWLAVENRLKLKELQTMSGPSDSGSDMASSRRCDRREAGASEQGRKKNMGRLFFGKAVLFKAEARASASFGENMSESRLGTVGIVVDDMESTSRINAILHQYADIIVGRLGIPYRSRGVSIIALAVDGSMDAISGMTGRLGKLPGVSVKAAISRR